MRWQRIWQHLKPIGAWRHFDRTAMERLEAVIAQAEHGHQGELRIVVEARLPLRDLWRDLPVRERAVQWFSDLRMWDTEHNTGVLVYLLLAERRVELVADRGIAHAVPQAQWQAICAQLIGDLAAGHQVQGLGIALEALGLLLAQHYPQTPGADDTNELPNQPILR
ncbi:TPM domain-containing protein [Chitiniphilus purpureus]|uniref:TPM domain-containing protein n=1 Tax=Chitiniphilus purpureus TaxID=2981137 RepID=A0ABY6DKP7_9NEIS|nr:TPM domain-containing protein [Chitiniphilus sp. CD1]UXY13686.1 TPM domain-containing protein [Chitiniphilus sp. CD1]